MGTVPMHPYVDEEFDNNAAWQVSSPTATSIRSLNGANGHHVQSCVSHFVTMRNDIGGNRTLRTLDLNRYASPRSIQVVETASPYGYHTIKEQ
jgi:hypothetical protein